MKAGILFFVFLLVSIVPSIAQCAMCRSVLENNLSNGNIGIAAGINFGILYLLLAPYTAILLIAYFWYKTSKNNARQNLIKRSTS
jgi:uncharacterized membrane protein